MNKRIVVGVSGAINSGKSTFAQSLAIRIDAVDIRFGQMVKALAIAKGLGTERGVLQELGAQLLADLGPKQFVENALVHSGWESQENLIFDGVRHVEIWKSIEDRFPNDTCVLLFLKLSDETREVRAGAEGEVIRPEVDDHSTERQVQSELWALSDLRINAENSVELMVELAVHFVSPQTLSQ